MYRFRLIVLMLLTVAFANAAERYVNLTAPEVRIDSVLPVVSFAIPLPADYADSTYSVSILYPDFIDMSPADVRRLRAIAREPLPDLPAVNHHIAVERKRASLELSLVPLVWRDGKYRKLVSFMLKIESTARTTTMLRQSRVMSSATERYADHSVLSTGRWVKIRVAQTGLYAITPQLLSSAGFSNVNRVKVYGYGGAIQPEQLTADYLAATDDLQEVPTTTYGGQRVFHATGCVTWDSNNRRVRNPYSVYGYYFLTESDGEPLTESWEDFQQRCYPLRDDYNTLYETDNFAWYQGGRNLYDSTPLSGGQQYTYQLSAPGTSAQGTLRVVVSGNKATTVGVALNDVTLGQMSISSSGTYDAMKTAESVFNVSNLQSTNTVRLTIGANNGTVRLDFISLSAQSPRAMNLTVGVPEVVGVVPNQDLHAHGAADMVIIVPTSLKLLKQAQRLKQLHEERDSMRVRIIAAGQLYNEFSSGTPDANAYRRYMKMLYDRAATEADMPRYLVLFGDGAWDNRMLSVSWMNYSPDDFLLCYESENSASHTDCYVSDDYFCLLDDGEGANMQRSDKADIAVGRFPVRDENQATIMVDKTEAYMLNKYAGAWQNTVCVMGDDGNENAHMRDADAVASNVEEQHPAMYVKRLMWDAYPRSASATGYSYPDVTRLIKQQMQQGALIMNYAGHGSQTLISHEKVLNVTDFQQTTSNNLPLWVTASCDIMPFDGQEENIGEAALMNKRGGAIAFFGTTRTVYQSYNRLMNLAFTKYVLGTDDNGQRLSLGEAVRLAKNELINTGADHTANKLQYSLLGDPALVLAMPTRQVVVDSINGVATATATENVHVAAGERVTLVGHVCDETGQRDATFAGHTTLTVRDVRELITCRRNDTSEAETAFTFYDRPNTIFNGSDSVRQGRFTISFTVPYDISYSEESGLVSLYAVNNEKTVEANGSSELLTFSGTSSTAVDSIGPAVYCYLNTADFTNGDNVNATPYFVALLSDNSGINATGSAIGHDLLLTIDGQQSLTYTLNDYFQYDFGSHTRGSVGFSIPTLSAGAHVLRFKAWDVHNNSTTKELLFNVVRGLSPELVSVECTQNPATTSTAFRIVHNRTGCELDVVLDVFDSSGRHLWQHSEQGLASDNTYTVTWDLINNSGGRLHTGVYLYRIRVSSDGSQYTSEAKKLIVLSNK